MTDAREADVVLGRLADPDAVATISLPGGCRCPGAPHANGDTATYRTELGAGEVRAVKVAGWAAADGEYYDWEAANDVTIAKAVTNWTILSGKPCQHPGKPHKAGEPVPVTRAIASQLDEDTRTTLVSAINDAYNLYQARLPNASGAPSADSSQESASPSPKTRRPSSSTTS